MRVPHLPGSYLVIELTNRCNLACVHCAVAEEDHPHHHRTGYIDVEIIEQLVTDLIATSARFDSLILFWLGEPLLHPHFNDIYRLVLRAAVEHGVFAKIEVHSNAILLTETKRRMLLNNAAVPQVLHCSLDASSAETYRQIKGRDRFQEAQQNARLILQEKHQRGAKWPRVVYQFIVGSNNVAEVPEFHRYWNRVAAEMNISMLAAAGHVPHGETDCIFFRQLDCSTALEQEQENAIFRDAMVMEGLQIPEESKQGEQVNAENLQACSGFWKSPVIGWTGEVTTCTRDNELDNAIGSLRDSRFSELWWGPLMKQRRGQVSCGDYAGLKLCSTCFIPRSLNHTSITPLEIQQHESAVGGV